MICRGRCSRRVRCDVLVPYFAQKKWEDGRRRQMSSFDIIEGCLQEINQGDLRHCRFYYPLVQLQPKPACRTPLDVHICLCCRLHRGSSLFHIRLGASDPWDKKLGKCRFQTRFAGCRWVWRFQTIIMIESSWKALWVLYWQMHLSAIYSWIQTRHGRSTGSH